MGTRGRLVVRSAVGLALLVDVKVRLRWPRSLGRLPMAGWRPTGDPVEPRIITGIDDITGKTGWVNVGVDHDTPRCSRLSIRRC
jgi:hypothetical protein